MKRMTGRRGGGDGDGGTVGDETVSGRSFSPRPSLSGGGEPATGERAKCRVDAGPKGSGETVPLRRGVLAPLAPPPSEMPSSASSGRFGTDAERMTLLAAAALPPPLNENVGVPPDERDEETFRLCSRWPLLALLVEEERWVSTLCLASDR
jgi:hypothetical protein